SPIREPYRQRLLTVKDFAKYIGRTEPAARHVINSGEIPVHKSDGRIFVDIKDADEWIEAKKCKRGDQIEMIDNLGGNMGCIYRRTKKLPDGTRQETGPFWIKYYQN